MFHEIHGGYYRAVEKILSCAVDGSLTKESMLNIVRQCAFEESVLTIPRALETQKWPLLTRELLTPLKQKPSMSLTTMQKRWMKTILQDPRIRLFGVTDEGLEDADPLYPADAIVWYDRYSDGDPYGDEGYIERFTVVLKALREKRKIRICFEGRKGFPHAWVCVLHRLEYSAKDDKLCAMETVKNHKNLFSTTQLAAMRVDENWVRKDTFHRPIEPLGPSFHLWQDPAFTGYSPQEFLNAQNAYLVLRSFENWLSPDDILCWWNQNEKELFVKFYSMTKKTALPHKMLDLKAYFHMAIQDSITLKGNAFKLCSLRGIPTTGKEHCSLDRVYAMSSFLHTVSFDQKLLLNPPQERVIEREYDPQKGHAYVYQPDSGLFHQTGCSGINQNSKMEGFGSLAGCMRRRFKPCPVCTLKDANAWRRQHNKDSIERSAYKYVFAQNGKVFHTTSCALVLNAKIISGCSAYASKDVQKQFQR